MPTARKPSTKKDAGTATKTRSGRGRKAKPVEEEVLEEAEDDDEVDEEAEATVSRRKITEEIAQRAAEMREEGSTWTEIQEETGFNGAQLRPHIARLTEATIEGLEDTPESVAEHREEGYAWYAMAISLGKTVAEVKEMAIEGGSDAEGRKYRSNGNGSAEAEADEDEVDEDEEDDEDEEEDEEEEAPAPKRRTAAKKSSTKTAPKAGQARKSSTKEAPAKTKARRGRPSKAA